MACLHCDLELSCFAVTSLQIRPLGPASSSSAAGLLSGLAPGTGQHPEGGGTAPCQEAHGGPCPAPSTARSQSSLWGMALHLLLHLRKGLAPEAGNSELNRLRARYSGCGIWQEGASIWWQVCDQTVFFSFLHCLIGLREAGSSNQIQRLLDWQWSGATPVSPQPYQLPHACANTPS